jgi:outer membrane murein-binding lipoprotein Lpp
MSFDASTISLAIGAVLFLGAAATFLRGSKDKGTITTLSSSNASLWEKVRLMEAERTAAQEDLLAVKSRLQVLEDTKTILTEAVTQAAAVAALSSEFRTFQGTYQANHAETLRKIQELLKVTEANP